MNKPTNSNKIFLSHYSTTEIPSNFSLLSLSDLDRTKDGSIEEIFVKDVIGGFSDSHINDFLEIVVKKIKTGGTMYIQDIDIEQLSIYLSHKILPIAQKNLLYANQRTNVFYMRYIANLLYKMPTISIQQMNFINGYEFFIKIKKI